MFPRTHKGEKSYRLKKRRLEIQIILSVIENHIKKHTSNFNSQLNILEFGCGNGFQIPYLQKLGIVTATDISIPNNLNLMKPADFVECDISNSPFLDDQFDLIFSNHVIEHIRELNKAFNELKRIGKRNCLYALSVPTNVWLLLSIPAQYLQKFRLVWSKLRSIDEKYYNKATEHEISDISYSNKIPIIHKLIDKLIPHGHGIIRSFTGCYHDFKIKSWSKLLTQHGFKLEETFPLLLYAPSEWPIIPVLPVPNRSIICSSVLFLATQK